MSKVDEIINEIDVKYAVVQDTDEAAAIIADVERLVCEISSLLGLIDPRFQVDLVPSGSTYETTKVIQQDEFDFLFVLKSFKIRESSEPEFTVIPMDLAGHAKVQINSDRLRNEWKDCLHDDSFSLDVTSMKKIFNTHITKITKVIVPPNNLKILGTITSAFEKTSHSGLVTFQPPEVITLKWKGNMKISIDCVLFISMTQANVQVALDCPANEFKSNLMHGNIGLVGRIFLFWRFSFSLTEAKLIEHLRNHHPQFLSCYRILKYMNETCFISASHISTKVHITSSYNLKNIIFHMWEKAQQNTSEALDQSRSPAKNLLIQSLSYFLECLREGRLPAFFNPQTNLLKQGDYSFIIEAVEKCIEKIDKATNVSNFVEKKIIVNEVRGKPLSQRKIEVIKPSNF